MLMPGYGCAAKCPAPDIKSFNVAKNIIKRLKGPEIVNIWRDIWPYFKYLITLMLTLAFKHFLANITAVLFYNDSLNCAT